MNETTAAEALRSLGDNLLTIASALDCAVFDDDDVDADRYVRAVVAGRTYLHVHPEAHDGVIATAIVDHAARRWGAKLDVQAVGLRLLRLLG